MPTPAEQKALAFVAIVILLGGAVRVVRAGSSPEPSSFEQQGLARQANSADSAAGAARQKRGRKGSSSRSRGDTLPKIVGGVATVPRTYARPDAPDAHEPYGTRSQQLGYPPPGPRIDVYGGTIGGRQPAGKTNTPLRSARIDLDRASAAEMEALPRVGPALAKHLVANRDSLGPFRTLQGLRRVRGVGPATLQLLGPLVTFGAGPDR